MLVYRLPLLATQGFGQIPLYRAAEMVLGGGRMPLTQGFGRESVYRERKTAIFGQIPPATQGLS